MRNVVLLMLLFCSTLSFSQKCKSKVDISTGKSFVFYEYVNPINSREVYFELNNDFVKFELSLSYSGETDVIIPEAQELFFKLEDNTIIKLVTSNNSNPVTKMDGYSVVTYYTYEFYISKENLEKFSEYSITELNCPYPDGNNKEFKLRNKTKKCVIDGAKCILSNYN
jgi:hypothetical protein